MDRRDEATRADRVWTIPNIISIVRLAGVPLFLWLILVAEADGWALVVLMLSGVTDYLDGYLARKLNQTSKLGEILDPVADRLYILSTVSASPPATSSRSGSRCCCRSRDAFLWTLVPFLRTRGYSSLPVHFLGKAATAACCTPSRCSCSATAPA